MERHIVYEEICLELQRGQVGVGNNKKKRLQENGVKRFTKKYVKQKKTRQQ